MQQKRLLEAHGRIITAANTAGNRGNAALDSSGWLASRLRSNNRQPMGYFSTSAQNAFMASKDRRSAVAL